MTEQPPHTDHPVRNPTEVPAAHTEAAAQALQADQATAHQAQAEAVTAAEAAIAEAEAGAEEAATVEEAAEAAVHHQAEDNMNLKVERI